MKEMQLVLDVLGALPLLEELVISMMGPGCYQNSAIHNVPIYYNNDEVKNLSGFTHDSLRKVTIQGFQSHSHKIEFVLCIINNARKLETLVINPFGTIYVEGVMKDVTTKYSSNSSNWFGQQNFEASCLEERRTLWVEKCKAVIQEKVKEVKTDARITIL